MSDDTRTDLGYANGWKEEPQQVKNCKAQNHPQRSQNLDPSHHGLDTLYWCDVCGYQYHVDSSD